jgi:plastocyanin
MSTDGTGKLRLAFAMVALIAASACSDHSSPANSAASTASITSPGNSAASRASTTSPANTGDVTIRISTPPLDVGAVVVIKDRAFNPSVVTIKAGQSVEWRFDDNGTAHSIEGVSRDDIDLTITSGTWTTSFDRPGTYPYHCGIHPEETGTVQVE